MKTELRSLVFYLAMAIVMPCKLLAQNKPNIIYILADDLGIGDLSIYNENGKIPTPNLDLMGHQGMKFNDAHTSSSVCTPTRYGILTGRYNWRTPLKSFVLWGDSPMLIRDDRLTVASMLQSNGYQTAVIGKWHLGLNWATKEGGKKYEYFSTITDRFDPTHIDYTQPLRKGTLDLGFDYSFIISASLNMPPYVYLEDDKVVKQPSASSEQKRTQNKYSHWIKGVISDDFNHEQVLPVFVDKAQAYIRAHADKNQPFFLYLPLPAPHNPIVPTEPWKGKSKINPYADFVMMIDDLMGSIFKTIKESGMEENTLVIFTSDNGCASNADFAVLNSKGHQPSYIYSGEKGSYLEGGHRVPFLVKWPKVIDANSVCNTTICTTDFMATVAELLEYKVQDHAAEDSYSMLPLFQQKDGFQRKETIHHSKTGVFAIRKGEWKLIVAPNSGVNAAGQPEKPNPELPENILYNLNNDVAETTNVAQEHPQLVQELKKHLVKQINEGRSTPGLRQDNDAITFPWVQTSFTTTVSNSN